MRNIYRSVHDIVYTTIIILFEDHALMIQVKLRKYNAEVHSLVEVGRNVCMPYKACVQAVNFGALQTTRKTLQTS